MALTRCSECGNTVSTNAASCPQCGNRIGRRSIQQAKIGCMVIVAIVGVFVILSILIGGLE